MLYVLGYTVSTLTGSSSGRYKNSESKLQNLVIHARRDPVWFTVKNKNECQDTPGGKDDRCVWLTIYKLQLPMSRNLGALTSHNTLGPIGL
jgi:hypothetical protein